MRAQIIEDFGTAEVFKLATLSEPRPGPGKVAIRQEASSVNAVDYKIRQGGANAIAPAFPAVLGCDISGTVIAVGDGVTEFKMGDAVNYRKETTEAMVSRLTAGKGFDIVFDSTGGPDLETDFQAARLNGQIVAIVSFFEADLSTLHFKGLSLHLVFMLLPMLSGIGGDDHKRILEELAELVDAGQIRPMIDPSSFTLETISAAHQHAESGTAVGKVVLDIAHVA